MVYQSYSEIRKIRDFEISKVSHNHFELNHFHDRIMLEVVKTALFLIAVKFGPSPSPFSFFVMGSAGRSEQAIWSDQDHGIIYKDQTATTKQYFLEIGKEISDGLFKVGYEYCDGDVMASNPLWCCSLQEWQNQLANWCQESSWESLRHLLIFIDGRSLYGEDLLLLDLKKKCYQLIKENHLMTRVLDNTLHIKRGLGVLGQFLVETHGTHSGALNLKERVLFPYVNAARLIAIKENWLETSTISRLQKLTERVIPKSDRDLIEKQFLHALHYRLLLGNHSNYAFGHYLSVNILTPLQKKELKDIIKVGNRFFQFSRKLVDHDGNK